MCNVESLAAQDMFLPVPELINCAKVTGRWGLLPHMQERKSGGWVGRSVLDVDMLEVTTA